jgi:hypothetical protein
VKTFPSLFWQWFAVACLAGVAALEVATVVRDGVDGGTLPGVLFGVVTVAIVLVSLFVCDSVRLRSVQAARPDAFVSNFLTFPELNRQLSVVAGLLGVPSKRLRYAGHSTIVIDSSGFMIFGGVLRPKVLFSAPGLHLLTVRTVRTRQGRWNLPCLEIGYGVGREAVSFNLPILQTWYGLPHTAHRNALERIVPELTKFVVAAK